MITISLSPLSLRRVWVALATLAGLCAASCFAQPILFSVDSTPYDRQMNRIQPILTKAQQAAPKAQVNLHLVNNWMWDLRSIPYRFSMQWKTPNEVATGSSADCKGKAVALYARMKARGAKNIRLVIGKKSVYSRSTHAWLEWSTPTGTYVLDPTLNWTAERAERHGNRSYLPMYAYAGTKKYRAVKASTLLAAR